MLTYGRRPLGEGWRARSLHAARAGRRNRRPHLREPARGGSRRRRGLRQAPVCTSGSAATVVITLLDALAASGCRFPYHGDFNWPGITLANRIIHRCEALPWRMGAKDYERLAAASQAEGGPQLPLGGNSVDADWDPGLAPAMTALGVALHK